MTTVEGTAVLMEVVASLRLFHGLEALQARISDEAPDLGVAAIAWAPTALAALVMGVVWTAERVYTGGRTASITTHIVWSTLMILALPR